MDKVKFFGIVKNTLTDLFDRSVESVKAATSRILQAH